MLTVEQLRAGYGSREVLHGVSLEVLKGEIAVLLGANGAGKSTTLWSIMGAVKKSGGRVLLEGRDISGAVVADNVLAGISLVPEGGRVFRDFTVLENLKLGAFTVTDARAVENRLARVVEIFPRLGERLHQRAGLLSGGERQMLAIGRGLMTDPRVMLLDEPLIGLAPVVVDVVVSAIRQVNREQGVTFLVVEQNIQVVSIADRAYCMRLGEIVLASDEPQSLLQDEKLEAAFIG